MLRSSTSAEPADVGDAWGPAVRGGRGRRGRRTLLIVLVLVVALPLVYGLALAVHANGAIARQEVAGLSPHEGGPLNLLVVGSDSREELTEQEQLELGTGYVEGERTDSIFVLAVDGSHAGVLAFPRDLWVTRCDGSTGRINSAYAIGGPGCLVDTVEQLSGLPIHHFVTVSFGGFRDIVDAVGGVHLCVEKDLVDPYAGLNLQAGCQTLSGAQALGYVRTRKLDNDLERIKRQQQFLGALADQLVTPSTLLNPPRAWNVTGAVGAAVTTDQGLGMLDLLPLARGLRGLAGGSAVTATVPATPATIGGAAVLQPKESEAAALFASFRDGSALRATPGEVTPADVAVRVLNGAGVAGLAATTRDALTARGYRVVGIGDTDSAPRSVVRFTPADRAGAELLAADLPVDVELQEVASGEITLILGDDLAGGLS